uniref:Uncharacterized protein n=1 Tax=Cacopsylla melanoneura TaxID=428564 RepID=A0A8D8V1R6_9HEMI
MYIPDNCWNVKSTISISSGLYPAGEKYALSTRARDVSECFCCLDRMFCSRSSNRLSATPPLLVSSVRNCNVFNACSVFPVDRSHSGDSAEKTNVSRRGNKATPELIKATSRQENQNPNV